ncbi:MAG: peroxiredoxin-like family protein [Hyphomicrobium sp.]
MPPPETLEQAFEAICLMDGPLNARLAAYAGKLEELNYPFAEAYRVLVAKLAAGGIGSQAPGVGESMPDFLLPRHDGHLVGLDELLAGGPLVISFNRGHWCPFCKIELKTIASHHREIESHGGRIVSILPDRQCFLSDLRHTVQDRIVILSDIDNGYALSLGLVMWLGDRLRELMAGRGLQLTEFQGNDGWFVPLPATFVIAGDGTVVSRHVDPDFRTRMEIGEILTALSQARTRTVAHRGARPAGT